MEAAKLDVNFTSADVVLSLLSPFADGRPAWKELQLPFSQYDCIINSSHIVKMRLTIITRIVIPARASGVLFVAGVGSYCAYRICTKYLGKRFVWTLLESARFDNPATADRRLLYACGLPLSDDEDGEYDDCDDRRSRRSSCSRAASEVSFIQISLKACDM
ncbi:hypothetical protein V3C99_016358 [Haemonchus contortus]